MRKYLIPALIILFALLIFLPCLNNFFSSDDWYFLKISQVHSLNEFLNFFSFAQTPQSAPFYRPLSTQIFFFIFYSLFGLNVLPYRLFSLFLFVVGSILVYLFAKMLLKNSPAANLVLFFYSVSAIHFTSIYFLSAIQELFLIVPVLLSLLFFVKYPSWKGTVLSTIFFVLALLSKETAVITPVLLWLILCFTKKDLKRGNIKQWILEIVSIVKNKRLWPFYLLLIPYFYFKITNPNPAVEDSYIFSSSPAKLVNTSLWYILWSFGIPEMLVDYVGSGFHIAAKLFVDYPVWSKIILAELVITLLSFGSLVIINLKKFNRYEIVGVGIFFISLLPVIFFPWHKFSYYLTVPIVGFSLFLSQLIIPQKKYKIISFIFIASFLVTNLSTIILDNRIHYSVNRGKISQKVFNYFKNNYPTEPKNAYFEFINDTVNHGVAWGSSKQIATAISESNMCQVLYQDLACQIFYQDDLSAKRPANKKAIEISSKQFLGSQ